MCRKRLGLGTDSEWPYLHGWLDVSVIYRPEFLQIISGLWMLIQGRILNHKMGEKAIGQEK